VGGLRSRGTKKASTLVWLGFVLDEKRRKEEQLTRLCEWQQKSVVVIALFISSSSFISQQTRMHSGPPLTSFFVAFFIDYLQPLTLLICGNPFPSPLLFFIWVSPLQLGMKCVIFKVCCFSLFQATPLSFSGSSLAPSLSSLVFLPFNVLGLERKIQV